MNSPLQKERKFKASGSRGENMTSCSRCGGKMVLKRKFSTKNYLIYECEECHNCTYKDTHEYPAYNFNLEENNSPSK